MTIVKIEEGERSIRAFVTMSASSLVEARPLPFCNSQPWKMGVLPISCLPGEVFAEVQ